MLVSCVLVYLTGHDVSVGMTHEPNLHLDLIPMPNDRMFVNLETPPRVITLDEQPLLSLEDTERREHGIINGHVRRHR